MANKDERIKVRDSFVFFASWHDCIRLIKGADKKVEAFDMICNYAIYGEIPDEEKLDRVNQILLKGAIPLIDSNNRKFEQKKERKSKKKVGEFTLTIENNND